VDQRTKDFFKSVNLSIATPCYGGVVGEQYARSMFNLSVMAASVGIQVNYLTIANESLVTRARNELVSAFLKDKESTHFMFIDADISFDPSSVLHMILKNKDVITGAYPLKAVDWDGIYENLDNINSAKELKELSTNYVINIKKPDSKMIGVTENITIEGGALPVYDAGTGFMMIKRHVFKKLIDAYPEMLYYSDQNISLPKKERKMYAFFDTSIDEDGRYLSEDYTFCRRWQKIGGEIYLDTDVVLNHFGSYMYKGHKLFK